jgi:ribose/xylose/arabinose/galactoside ABC-type transport system permease subunit
MMPTVSSYIKDLAWGLILLVVIILNWHSEQKRGRPA